MVFWTTGDVITAAKLNLAVPTGAILMWHGLIANIPTEYVICDGTNGTPDLRSKFLRGAPAATEAGGTGGADTHTITTDEIPAHTHTVPVGPNAGGYGVDGGNYTGSNTNSGAAGGGGAHNNMPSYYEIIFIMKT